MTTAINEVKDNILGLLEEFPIAFLELSASVNDGKPLTLGATQLCERLGISTSKIILQEEEDLVEIKQIMSLFSSSSTTAERNFSKLTQMFLDQKRRSKTSASTKKSFMLISCNKQILDRDEIVRLAVDKFCEKRSQYFG